jgi:hypothetical protein
LKAIHSVRHKEVGGWRGEERRAGIRVLVMVAAKALVDV